MAPHEYRMTAEADPSQSCRWIIRIWLRDVHPDQDYGAWRCVLVYDYDAVFRDEARPYETWKRMLKHLKV